ncbi:hypothetical protein B0H14DRAFT_2612868 [Mycena olivaceomarginata]|nr:hypothetical protein B0H14DRAFT_2612868 [Mycena olivaceomarginata]
MSSDYCTSVYGSNRHGNGGAGCVAQTQLGHGNGQYLHGRGGSERCCTRCGQWGGGQQQLEGRLTQCWKEKWKTGVGEWKCAPHASSVQRHSAGAQGSMCMPWVITIVREQDWGPRMRHQGFHGNSLVAGIAHKGERLSSTRQNTDKVTQTDRTTVYSNGETPGYKQRMEDTGWW